MAIRRRSDETLPQFIIRRHEHMRQAVSQQGMMDRLAKQAQKEREARKPKPTGR